MKNMNREDFIELFAMVIYLTSISYAWAVTFFPVQSQHNADVTLGFIMGSALTIVLQHLFKTDKNKEDDQGTD